jgi:ribokinase
VTGAAKFDVLVCGSLHLDIVVKAPGIPRIDETMVGHAWLKVCGGKGGNQAVQASRAGARTAMIGRVGRDEFGTSLLEHLKAAKIDHSCVTSDSNHGSGMSVAILQDNGDYGAVIVSGANLAIDATAIEREMLTLGSARVLVLQNEVPEQVNLAAARAAKSRNIQVLLNAAPARKLDPELLKNTDVLIVNRIEAEAMFGTPVRNREAALNILDAQKPLHCSIVITLGAEGLVLAGPDIETKEILPHPVSVVSTHGAGDSFVGKLAAELARGVGLIESCAAANTYAAAFVSRAH